MPSGISRLMAPVVAIATTMPLSGALAQGRAPSPLPASLAIVHAPDGFVIREDNKSAATRRSVPLGSGVHLDASIAARLDIGAKRAPAGGKHAPR